MTPDAIEQAATIIAENRLNGTRLGSIDEAIRPVDLHDAYAVQERHNEILAERGMGKLVGYKIGCTTPVMQEYMNIHEPAFGEVFDSMVFRDHAELKRDDFVEPGVETEIAVTLAHDLPSSNAPYTRESVRDAVGGRHDLDRTGRRAISRLPGTRHPDNGRGQFLQRRSGARGPG